MSSFSIHPIKNCPHVDSNIAPVDKSVALHGSPCNVCADCTENWLCMSCLKVHCSRFINGHAADHVAESGHCIALSFTDHSTWCYQCESYITSLKLSDWYDHVYKTKFNEAPSFNIHTVAFLPPDATIEMGSSSSSSGSSSSSSSSTTAESSSASASSSATNTTTNTAKPSPPKSSLSNEEVIDRIKGVLFGQAIGDAFGLATEFLSVETAIKFYGKNGPKGYSDIVQDSHRDRWVQGDWTDDTDQMIVILKSIVKNKGIINISDISKGFYDWMKHGFPDFGDLGGFGLGRTVGSVLRHPNFLENPHSVAKEVCDHSMGFAAANGAVMRTSVLGVLNFDDIDKVIENTVNVCLITHADPRCIASCVAITTAIALILQGKYNPNKPEDMAELAKVSLEYGLKHLEDESNAAFREEFKKYASARSVDDLKLDDGGIGYTFKAFGCGFLGLKNETGFETLLRKIVMAAGDADTNGAVFGGVAGARAGYNALPSSLRDSLVYKDWLATEISELLKTMGY